MRRVLRTITSMSLVVMLLLGNVLTVRGDALPQTEFTLIAESDSVQLFAITEGKRTGEFYVRSGNAVWYSNPQNRPEKEPEGMAESALYSQLLFTVYDTDTKTEDKYTSYEATDSGKRVRSEIVSNGIRFLYIFDSIHIAVPLELKLKNGTLKAEIIAKEIVEQEKVHLLDITLLPYFGCADETESGFLFVPDGSGAIIYHNNGKTKCDPYRQKVYGEDPSIRCDLKSTYEEQLYMPVFGIGKGNDSFLTVIEDGAESAAVEACVAGMKDSYNRVSAEFTIHSRDTVVIGNPNSSKAVRNTRYCFSEMLSDRYSLKYLFLNGRSDYYDMAMAYRGYLGLTESNQADQNCPTVHLELYGGIKKEKSILGIPVRLTKNLTTVSQAQEIVKEFKNHTAANVSVQYRYFDGNLLNEKIQNTFALKSSLGTTKELKKLKQFLDGRLYLEFDPFTVTKSGNGYIKYIHSAKRIGKDSAESNLFKISTYYSDTTFSPIRFVQPKKLYEIGRKYIDSVQKKGFFVGLPSLANTAYTDYNDKMFTSRSDTVGKAVKLIDQTNGDTVLQSPNAYAFGYAKRFSDTPTTASRFDIEDADVPFYQLVLNGCCEYSVESINLSDHIQVQFLKAIACGADLQFSFVFQNASELKGTRLQSLYGADYRIWRETAFSYEQELEDVYQKLGSRRLISHQILADGVFLSEFSTGKSLIINTNEETVITDYGTVEPLSYLIVS